MATVDVKYDTTPHDGTPGPPWDDFEERILGVAAGRTDDRGWSLADCANQTDEGGVGGPPMPAAGAAAAKAQTARRKRLKELYALLYKHELDTDHRTHVYQNHFQDGDAAFQYLIATMRTPIDLLQLRELQYYERATMLIKRAVLMLLLQPYLIGTTSMIVDLFTKALEKGQYE